MFCEKKIDLYKLMASRRTYCCLLASELMMLRFITYMHHQVFGIICYWCCRLAFLSPIFKFSITFTAQK